MLKAIHVQESHAAAEVKAQVLPARGLSAWKLLSLLLCLCILSACDSDSRLGKDARREKLSGAELAKIRQPDEPSATALDREPWPEADALAAREFAMTLTWRPSPRAQTITSRALVVIDFDLKMRGVVPGDDVYAMIFLGERGGFLAELFRKDDARSKSKLERMVFSSDQFGFNDLVKLTLKGETEPFAGFVRLSATGLRLTVEATLERGSRSFFRFGDSPALVHFSVPATQIARLFSSMFVQTAAAIVGDEKDLDESFKAPEEENGFLVTLNLVYLGTARTSAAEQLTTSVLIVPPDLPFAFDSLVVMPVIVRSTGPDAALIHYDMNKAPPLSIPAKSSSSSYAFDLAPPNRESRRRDPVPKRPPLPDLEILVEPGAIPRGRAVVKRFRVRHGPAAPGAEVYVALQPAISAEDMVLARRKNGIVRTKGQSMELTACRTQTKAGLMHIRESPIFIDNPGLLIPDIEAGRIGVVTATAGGVVEGRLTFSTPALAEWYDAVRATPLLFQWEVKDGSFCAKAIFRAESGLDIPLLGR